MGEPTESLSIRANIKIGTFHIGSAMTDILGSGVWNRIMIADLGYPATPVSLLLALNYFLSPLSVWVGQRSDHTNWRGYRRLPWVWGGRGLMAIGFLLLVFNTIELAESGNNLWWLGIAASLFMVSIGYLCSGSTYTTLIYDRAPAAQRGRAVGVVWTMLLMGFAFAGVLFSNLLPEYSVGGLATLFVTTIAIASALWFFSVLGEERPRHDMPPAEERPNFRTDFQAIWSKPTTRLFFLYIALSFMGAFAQDQILEPFGGQVFDLSTGETSRFAAYWGTTALLGSVFALAARRRLSGMTYQRINRYGIGILVTTFGLLALTAFTHAEAMVRPTLLIFGAGLGLWNIGSWGLMVMVSSDKQAGTYFGLWTMASLLFRGGGSVIGAAIRDIGVLLSATPAFSYGIVFALEGVVMVVALMVLNQVPFAETETAPDHESLLVAVGAEA